MTQRITVFATYYDSVTGQSPSAPLMVLRVEDDNAVVTTLPGELEKKNISIKFVHAVELFATLDPNNLSESGAPSFFFSTIHKDSTLTAEKYQAGKAFWKLVREDGAEIRFRPEMQLKLKLRSPLFWAKRDSGDSHQQDEGKIELEFSFKDVDDHAGHSQANKNKCVRFAGNDFDMEREVDSGFDLTDLVRVLNDGHSKHLPIGAKHWRDDDHYWAPKLLLFDNFNLGPAPLGTHYYSMCFESFEEKPVKYGLKFGYNCVSYENHAGWGTDEANASRLWPFGIAPLANYETMEEVPLAKDRKYDISAKQISDSIDQVEWDFEFYSFSSKRLLNGFTPLGFWNERIAARYSQALSTAKGHDPGSILPRFDSTLLDDKFRSHWKLHYRVIDTAPHWPIQEEQGGHDPHEWLAPEQFVFDVGKKSNPNDKSALTLNEVTEIDVRLLNFQTKDGAALTRRFRFESLNFQELSTDQIDDDDNGPGFSVSVHDLVDVTLPQEPAQSRVGALDLYFLPRGTNAVADQSAAFNITTIFQGLDRLQKGKLDGRKSKRFEGWQPAVFANVILQLGAFGAGDQDPLPTEGTRAETRRVSSIIIPLDNEKGLFRGPFLLVVTEEATRSVNHSLRLRLERGGVAASKPDATDGFDLIVLDTEPFLISRVKARMELAQALEIGNWTGDSPGGASWELKDLGAGFDMIVPPQTVGEEFIRKYDEANQSTYKPLDYRFSPPGSFKLSRTPFKQSFSEAPWNLRRLLGYPGQRQPGMGVYSLKFELLYGLTTTISTDPSDLNLTELNALIGNPPAPLDRTPAWYIENAKPDEDFLRQAYEAYSNAVRKNLEQIKTRIGLLQPRLPNQKTPFLTLRDGVSYRFRCSRQVASPFDQVGEPIPGCPELTYSKDGLRGGVDWGFTSRNVYNEVLESGPSSSGLITNPSFTALGGNGFQKASFARDKSSIYSDTYLGRTFFYSLERIGRIGMLWNTAKHVIIFERSVVHTQQFPDPKNDWLGRPVVRKVREFVEILQPERSYPEFGEAPVVRGFARGSKFPHPVINVDSVWGRDIPGGWIVPLHNPAANQDVYPPPQALLKLTTSDKQSALPVDVKAASPAVKNEDPFVWGSITNPEDLVFYTSTNPKDDANTDGWQPVVGVDFPLAAIPTNDDVKDLNSVGLGYERFSLRVNTGGTPVNLLAERLTSISDAVVENVSLVRRNLEEAPASAASALQGKIDEALAQGKQIEGKLKQDIEGVLAMLRSPGTKLQDIVQKIGNLGKQSESDIDALKTKYEAIAKERIITLITQAHASLKTAWTTRFDQLTRVVRDDLADIIARTKAGEDARKKAVAELLQIYQRQVDNATNLLDQFRESIARGQALLDDFSKVLEKGAGKIRISIDDAIALVKEGPQYSPEKIQVYRQQVLAIVSVVESNITTARKQLSALDHTMVQKIDDAYVTLIAKLLPPEASFPLKPADIAVIDIAANDLKDAAGKLRDSLNLDASVDFKEIKAKLAELDKMRESLRAQIEKQITPFLNEVKEFNQEAIDGLAGLEKQLRADASNIFESAESYGADLKKELERGLGQFSTIADAVRQRIARARLIAEQIMKGMDGLDALSDEVQGRIKTSLNGVTQGILGPVRDAVAPYEEWAKEAEKLNIPALVTPEAQKLADRTLRLLRAHGLPPIGEAINLDKDRIAYYFNERARDGQNAVRQLENAVDITSAKALVNRVSDLAQANIKSLGIELPSKRIAEKFAPDLERLRNLRLKDVLPDFAGIKLSDIFSDDGFPLTQSETVRITHGIDPSTYRPWAQCNVDLSLTKNTDVFNVAAVVVTIQRGKFTAHTRIGIDLAGGMKREVQAAIFADWVLTVAGQRVMTIKNSTLHFDDTGKIKFDMGAKDIELAAVMKFITDLLATVNMGNKSGLSFELLKEGMLPVGARASLSLALPALQTGAFSISNLALTALFEVAFKGGDFYLALGLGLSTKERPFNLSVMCLGGGGWLTVKALYLPARGQITALLSIGISAGACLPFEIGVASGGIYILVGLGVEFTYGGGRGSLTMLLRVSITGELVILGIISVCVMIALEARYGEGSLVCIGMLSVSIKICWCFTLSVSTGFSITLAGSGGSSGGDLVAADNRTPREKIADAVTRYLASFGG